MLVELKNGETLNGHLLICDTWMNLTLKEVVQTSPEGDRFTRLPEVYVKGSNVSTMVSSLLSCSFLSHILCHTDRQYDTLANVCSCFL